MDQHKTKIAHLSSQIKTHPNKTLRIYHGSTNSTRPSTHTHTKQNTLDISNLNNILSINQNNKTCLVEPNVPMDKLLNATLSQHNLMPAVIPEFPGITVGGAFAGTAGESSSFRYGFFDRCVRSIEIILANGEIIHAKKDGEYADLLIGAAGSFGTLGVITALEIDLVPARKYVRVQYHVINRSKEGGGDEEMVKDVQHYCRGLAKVDYIDGIMFSQDQGVIITGILDDGIDIEKSPPSKVKVKTFTKPKDEWFYLHVRKKLTQSTTTSEDLIPLTDYIFRYDRGSFWTGRYAFSYFITPFNRLTRWILDPLMHTRVMYHALHRSGLHEKFVIQDMVLPFEKVASFWKYLDHDLDLGGIYPRWICPVNIGKEGISMGPHHHHRRNDQDEGSSSTTTALENKNKNENENEDDDNTMMLNIGLWGPIPNSKRDPIDLNRKIESKLKSLGGVKWLYAQSFYTRDEFWDIYDLEAYQRLRTKYGAQGKLLDVFEKVGYKQKKKDGKGGGIWKVWPLAGIYGLFSAIKGGDYLRK